MHHSTLRTLSGQWLICHPEPHCGQHIVAICMCHEHVEGSETERLPLRPHACGIVYLLTSNFTGRRQHLSNAVLKLFYFTGASLNICTVYLNAEKAPREQHHWANFRGELYSPRVLSASSFTKRRKHFKRHHCKSCSAEDIHDHIGCIVV